MECLSYDREVAEFNRKTSSAATVGSNPTQEQPSQPWRTYWPPILGSTYHIWLQHYFPDLTSWRFISQRLFEKPWRSWLYRSRMIQEDALAKDMRITFATTSILSPLPEPSPEFSGDDLGEWLRPRVKTAVELKEGIEALDGLIRAWQLPSVTPSQFGFLAQQGLSSQEKLYKLRVPCPSDIETNNLVLDHRPVTIYDISGHQDSFDLDESGFSFTKCPIQIKDWTDDVAETEYIPRLKAWLKDMLRCESVLAYSYGFRRHRSQDAAQHNDFSEWKSSFSRAHCDKTGPSSCRTFSLYFPDEYKLFKGERVRVLNVWRPLTTPIQDCPLAVCDYRTVDHKDLKPIDIIYPHFIDEGLEVLYNADQRWFYKRAMEWDDLIIFKMYDTLEEAATLCPHSAFLDPSVTEQVPARSSIEVKAFVIG